MKKIVFIMPNPGKVVKDAFGVDLVMKFTQDAKIILKIILLQQPVLIYIYIMEKGVILI